MTLQIVPDAKLNSKFSSEENRNNVCSHAWVAFVHSSELIWISGLYKHVHLYLNWLYCSLSQSAFDRVTFINLQSPFKDGEPKIGLRYAVLDTAVMEVKSWETEGSELYPICSYSLGK